MPGYRTQHPVRSRRSLHAPPAGGFRGPNAIARSRLSPEGSVLLRPLHGLPVVTSAHPARAAVVTRDEDARHGRLGVVLRDGGASVLHWPVTGITGPADSAPLQAAARDLRSYDWLVLTSRRGVAALAEVVDALPEGLRLAVVGEKTAEAAEDRGWSPDLVGDDTSEELVEALIRELGELGERPGQAAGTPTRLLFPTTPLAADTLPDLLEVAGHRVDRVEAYRTVYRPLDIPACRDRIQGGGVGVVTFTSPSAVEGLERALPADLFGELAGAVPAVSIGPTTTEAVEARGWACTESGERSLEGVARATLELLDLAGPPSTNESKGEADT